MGKNLAILALSALCLALWVWPRLGMEHLPPTPPRPPSTPLSLGLAQLEDTLQSMQATPDFAAASLGFCLLDGENTPILKYRAQEAMTPASTLKAVTSATALEMLGPDFRFQTQLLSAAPFELDPEGTYAGDLILLGGGDPMLTRVDLAAWARTLREQGLKRVQGRLIGDARHFPEQFTINAWDWGDVSNYYGAGPCGLNLDFNRFTVAFAPSDTLGQPARIVSMSPPLPWVERLNFTQTVAAGENDWTSIYGGPYTSRLTFRGHIPQGLTEVESEGAIPDPAYHATLQFEALLKLEGIELTESATTMRRRHPLKTTPTPASAPSPLLSHTSPALPEIIRYLHRTSDNMVTECLLQELVAQDPQGRNGRELVLAHWQARGIALRGLRMEDGSGLARADYIRPLDLASVLATARLGPHGDVYAGTFNAYHNGRIHWKGGSMSKVRAYTGFTDHGYTFALMINHYDADSETIGLWRSRLMELLLSLPATEAPSPGLN